MHATYQPKLGKLYIPGYKVDFWKVQKIQKLVTKLKGHCHKIIQISKKIHNFGFKLEPQMIFDLKRCTIALICFHFNRTQTLGIRKLGTIFSFQVLKGLGYEIEFNFFAKKWMGEPYKIFCCFFLDFWDVSLHALCGVRSACNFSWIVAKFSL